MDSASPIVSLEDWRRRRTDHPTVQDRPYYPVGLMPYCFNHGGSVKYDNRTDPAEKYCDTCRDDGWGAPAVKRGKKRRKTA